MRALLDAGASASAAVAIHRKKKTPSFAALHNAAYSGLVTIIRLLLDAGADLNYSTPHGYMPLMYAAVHGHHRLVVLLLSRGAIVTTKELYARGCNCNFLREQVEDHTRILEGFSVGYLSRITHAGSFANYQKQQRAKLVGMLAPKFSHLLPPEMVSYVITFWGHIGWK